MSTASKARKSYRGVAQFGRALRSGRRGRVFESRRFDFNKETVWQKCRTVFLLFFKDWKSNADKHSISNPFSISLRISSPPCRVFIFQGLIHQFSKPKRMPIHTY